MFGQSRLRLGKEGKTMCESFGECLVWMWVWLIVVTALVVGFSVALCELCTDTWGWRSKLLSRWKGRRT